MIRQTTAERPRKNVLARRTLQAGITKGRARRRRLLAAVVIVAVGGTVWAAARG